MLRPEMHEAQQRTSQRLLGSRATQSIDGDLSWTSCFSLKDEPWLSDQILFGNTMFPMAGYIAIAGECVRQLFDSKLQFFLLKDLSINSALFLKADDKIELHTKLRLKELDEKKRQWYEIEIACHNGTSSTGLCTGLVAQGVVVETGMLQDLAGSGTACRSVSSDYWYDMIADRGIKYGAAQRGLTDISTAWEESKASATIVPVLDPANDTAHPVFIDHCLQVSMIAACKGQGRLLTDLYVITSIQDLIVCTDTWDSLRVNGVVNPGRLRDLTYNFSAVNEGGLPILSGQCGITPVSDLERQSDKSLFSFTKWETDSTYHNLNHLLAPFQSELDSTIALERLALLYALRTEDLGAQSQRYSKRVLKTIGTKRKGRFGLVPDVSPFVECKSSGRIQLVKSLKAQISETNLSFLDLALESCLTDDTPFSGSADERQSLLDQLHPLVRNNGTLTESLRLLAHKKPKLNILEFGSDTKDSTNLVLKAVRTQFDEPLYSSYLFASTSAIATTSEKESLKANHNVQSLHFDTGKGIEQQGLKAGTYDLVIITDFTTLASDVKSGAKILKQLLHPQGYVMLLDGVPEPEWSSILKSYLTEKSPNVSTGSSTKPVFGDVCAALLENGFVFDDQDSKSVSAPQVFARLKPSATTTPSEITIVGPAYHLPLVREVEKTFEKHNIQCVKTTIDGKVPSDRDMMVFVDFDEPYLYNITEAELSQLVKLVSSLKGKMIWVTPSAQLSCKNPNSSLILGLMRTMRSEYKKDITVVELESKRAMNVNLSKSLLKIYEGLSRRATSKDLDHDYEYAIVNGEIKIPRLQWTTAEAEYAHIAARSAGHDVGARKFSSSTDKAPTSVQFRPDRCYVLVGGLGGLGRMLSTWMVENGARNIVFFSRSAREGPETTPFFDELRAQGCTVTPFAGSVTNLPDVQELVAQAKTPIAGVIQMSAVMRDNLMSHMTFADWQTSVGPKVQGTWNLHHATSSLELDFFLLFSSICGITGQWGQGNYNAANSFLDAFVNYRHSQNLPASVIDIGFMGSIGMAVESEALVKHLKGSGYHYLNERHLIDAVTISLANSRPEGNQGMHRSQLGLGIRSTKPMSNPKCRVVWKKDPRMAISHHLEPIGSIGDHELKDILNRTYSTRAH